MKNTYNCNGQKSNDYTLQVIDRHGDFEQYYFNTEAEALDFQRRLIDETSG